MINNVYYNFYFCKLCVVAQSIVQRKWKIEKKRNISQKWVKRSKEL